MAKGQEPKWQLFRFSSTMALEQRFMQSGIFALNSCPFIDMGERGWEWRV